MKKFLTKFWSEEDGPTAVEYAIMLALIIGVLVLSITVVGGNTDQFYSDTGVKMQDINNLAAP